MPSQTLPYPKTSPVSCENQSFFRIISKYGHLYRKSFHFFVSFFQYDEELLSSLLDGCHQDLVFLDPVIAYSESKLQIVNEKVSLKSKISFGYVCLLWFLLSQFSTFYFSIFRPPVDVQLKQRNPLCWAYPRLIFFKVKWWQNIGKTISISKLLIKRCKPTVTISYTRNFAFKIGRALKMDPIASIFV